jgi:hypothetical protein
MKFKDNDVCENAKNALGKYVHSKIYYTEIF